MVFNKLKIYIFEILLIVVLLFALFASNNITRIALAVFMLIYTIVVCLLFKRKKIDSIYERQVIILMLIFAIIYVGVAYLLGLYYGFVKPRYILSLGSFFKVVIPVATIIICSEIIRKKLLSQDVHVTIKGKKLNISIVLIYIAMTLIDLTIYTGIYDLTNLEDFLTALGFVLFASLSCNLLFNYISSRFSYKGIIIYRLLTVLYVYLLPVVPDIYIFLRSFLRLLYPFIIYLVFERTYSKSNFAVAYKDKKRSIVGTAILLVVVTLMIMLISCQFHYGIIVIGSDSMTGSINKGDAIVFEKYNNERIENGQIIMFDFNGIKTIHRIVEIRVINGEPRFFTKGDANEVMDSGYRTANDIIGLAKLKVKYIGLPTIWLRSLFKK